MALTIDAEEKQQAADAEQVQTEEQKAAVKQAADWFEADKGAKDPIRLDMEEDAKMLRGDHWDLLDASGAPLRDDDQKRTRPNAAENVSFALVEGLTSEFAQDVDLIDYPFEESDDPVAGVLTDLKAAIADKNRIRLERLKFNRNFFGFGTGIWEHVWDPNWLGGRGPNHWVGEVRWRSLHPQAAYPDARCHEDIHEGRRFHKAVYVPIEHIKERYPEWASLIQADTVDTDDLIGYNEDDTHDQQADTLADQVQLIETWYVGEPLTLDEGEKSQGSGLHVIWWAGHSQQIFLKHANYVYFDPGETPRFPFTFRARYQRDNSPWGYSENHYLKYPQIALNKTSEIVLEGHMHQAIGQTFYEPGALSKKQEEFVKQNGTIPGMWFAVDRLSGVERKFGQGVPGSVLQELNRIQRAMETIIGRFDISQGRTPGSVTAFRALDLLAQRAQVRLRSAEEALTSAYEDVGNYINRLIWLNYNERRKYRLLGKTDKDPVKRGEFVADDHKRVYVYGEDEVYPLKDFQAKEGMVEGEDYEVYAPELDVKCKVSTSLATDRVFYMEMAKELYMAQLIGPQSFFYVLDRGKFPPTEDMLAETAQRAQAPGPQPGQPALPGQPAAGAPAPPDANPQPPTEEEIANLLANLPPEAQDRFDSLPPDQQEQFIQELLASSGGEVGPNAA